MPRRVKNTKSSVENHRLVKIKIIVKGKIFEQVVPSNIEPYELQMIALRLGNISILQLCKWTMFLRREDGDEEILMTKLALRYLFSNYISPVFVLTPDDPDMPHLPFVDPQNQKKGNSHKENKRDKSRNESITNEEEEFTMTESDNDEDDGYTLRQSVKQTYVGPKQQSEWQTKRRYSFDTIKSKSAGATSSSVLTKVAPYKTTRGRKATLVRK